MPSSKRNPWERGAISGRKGQRAESTPRGRLFLTLHCGVPGLRTSRGDVGLWKPTDCPRAEGTVFRVQGACLPVSFLYSDFLSPAGGKARLMRRSDYPQTRPASHRRQTTSPGSPELRTSGSLVGFFSGPGETQTQPRGCARRVNAAEVCQEGVAGGRGRLGSDALSCSVRFSKPVSSPGPRFPELGTCGGERRRAYVSELLCLKLKQKMIWTRLSNKNTDTQEGAEKYR